MVGPVLAVILCGIHARCLDKTVAPRLPYSETMMPFLWMRAIANYRFYACVSMVRELGQPRRINLMACFGQDDKAGKPEPTKRMCSLQE